MYTLCNAKIEQSENKDEIGMIYSFRSYEAMEAFVNTKDKTTKFSYSIDTVFETEDEMRQYGDFDEFEHV